MSGRHPTTEEHSNSRAQTERLLNLSPLTRRAHFTALNESNFKSFTRNAYKRSWQCAMEDEPRQCDYTEAVEAVISKRKYLLNSLFDLEHFPTEDPASTEDDDFTYEPMKRKY